MTLKKVVKDIGIVGISRIVTSISGLILLPVLTRTLGAYGYGLWVQALATVGIVIPIIRLGLPYSMTRFFPGKEMKEIREDFYSMVTLISITAFTFSLLLYLFPYPIANAIFDGETTVVRIVAIIIFVRCLDELFLTVFRAFREMKKHSILSVATKYGEIGLAIYLVLNGYGIIGALIAILVVRSTLFIILLGLISKKIPFRQPNLPALREYLDFGIPTISSTISYWVVETSDRYLIGFFLGATFVGYYAPGYALGKMLPFMIIGMIAFVLPPTLSNYYENDDISSVKSILNLCMKYFLMISIPYLIGAILLGYPILLLLTTPEIAREGYIILFFSGLAALFYGIKVISGQILFLKKKTKLSASFYFTGAIINVVGNIILIPRIGILGAAIMTTISYFIALCLTIFFAYRELPIKPDFVSTTKVIFSSAVMGLVVYSARQYMWSNLFFLMALGVVAYFSLLYAIGGIKKKEIEFLKGMTS